MQNIYGKYVCDTCKQVSEPIVGEKNSMDAILTNDAKHSCGNPAPFIPLYTPAIVRSDGYIINPESFLV